MTVLGGLGHEWRLRRRLKGLGVELDDGVVDRVVWLVQAVDECLRRPAVVVVHRAFFLHASLDAEHLQAAEGVSYEVHDVAVRPAHVVAELAAADRAVAEALPLHVATKPARFDQRGVVVRNTVAVDVVHEVGDVHLDGAVLVQPAHVGPSEGLGLGGAELNPQREAFGLDRDSFRVRVERHGYCRSLGDGLLDNPDAVDFLEVVVTLVHLSP